MKSFTKLMSVIALLAIVAACTPAPTATQAPAAAAPAAAEPTKEPYLIGVTTMEYANAYFTTMVQIITEEVEKRGGKVLHIDAALDQLKQNEAIEDMITKGIDALILVPHNREAVQPALESLAKAKIPVVNLDSGVKDLSLVASFISSNNYQCGNILGKEMLRLNPDGGKLALMKASACESCMSRYNGIVDALKGSKVTVIEKDISTVDKVLADTEDFIQAHPDITAMYGINDPVSMMMLGVVESAGLKDQIKVYGIDGAPSCKQSINDGGMTATAAQSPIKQAVMGVEFVYKLLAGEKVEPLVSIECELITKENVQKFGLDGWQ